MRLRKEHVHDRNHDVQTDQIAQRQRAHRMVCTQLHGRIDILCGSDAFLQDEKDTQEKVKKAQAQQQQRRRTDKEW